MNKRDPAYNPGKPQHSQQWPLHFRTSRLPAHPHYNTPLSSVTAFNNLPNYALYKKRIKRATVGATGFSNYIDPPPPSPPPPPPPSSRIPARLPCQTISVKLGESPRAFVVHEHACQTVGVTQLRLLFWKHSSIECLWFQG